MRGEDCDCARASHVANAGASHWSIPWQAKAVAAGAPAGGRVAIALRDQVNLATPGCPPNTSRARSRGLGTASRRGTARRARLAAAADTKGKAPRNPWGLQLPSGRPVFAETFLDRPEVTQDHTVRSSPRRCTAAAAAWRQVSSARGLAVVTAHPRVGRHTLVADRRQAGPCHSARPLRQKSRDPCGRIKGG